MQVLGRCPMRNVMGVVLAAPPMNHLQNGQGGQPGEVAAAIAVAALAPRATSNTSANEYTFLIANSFRRFWFWQILNQAARKTIRPRQEETCQGPVGRSESVTSCFPNLL